MNNSPPFSVFQINKMLERRRPSEEWKTAFEYYNETSGERKVSVNCIPCYYKVAIYIINKHKNPNNE